MPNSLTIHLQNQTNHSQLFAYITGLALQHNNARVFLRSDGRGLYYPQSPPPGKILQPMAEDCAIWLGHPGNTVSVTIPQIAGGRIWFSSGEKRLTFLLNPGGPGGGAALVEPSVLNPSDPNADVDFAFAEFTLNNDQLFANISYVDFVPRLPVALTLQTRGGQVQHVSGMAPDGLQRVCDGLRAQAARDGRPWDKLIVPQRGGATGIPLRALAPTHGNAVGASFDGYFEPLVDAAWEKYREGGSASSSSHGHGHAAPPPIPPRPQQQQQQQQHGNHHHGLLSSLTSRIRNHPFNPINNRPSALAADGGSAPPIPPRPAGFHHQPLSHSHSHSHHPTHQTNFQKLRINTQAAAGIVEGSIPPGSQDLIIANERFPKPTTADILGCNSGPFSTAGASPTKLAIIPRLAAAFQRSCITDCCDHPSDPCTFYKCHDCPDGWDRDQRRGGERPTNHYARIVHECNLDGKGYAFAYDDVQPDGGIDQSGKVNAGDPAVFIVAVGGGGAYVGDRMP